MVPVRRNSTSPQVSSQPAAWWRLDSMARAFSFNNGDQRQVKLISLVGGAGRHEQPKTERVFRTSDVLCCRPKPTSQNLVARRFSLIAGALNNPHWFIQLSCGTPRKRKIEPPPQIKKPHGVDGSVGADCGAARRWGPRFQDPESYALDILRP